MQSERPQKIEYNSSTFLFDRFPAPAMAAALGVIAGWEAAPARSFSDRIDSQGVWPAGNCQQAARKWSQPMGWMFALTSFIMPMQDWQLRLHLLLLLQQSHRPCHLGACRWLGGGLEPVQDRALGVSCSAPWDCLRCREGWAALMAEQARIRSKRDPDWSLS